MKERIIKCLSVGDIQTNCWIYSLAPKKPAGCGAECAVIDPGGEASYIIAVLKELNLRPRWLLLTHGHFDHILALPELAAAFAGATPRPAIAIHREDGEYLGPASFAFHHSSMISVGYREAQIKSLWKDMPPADKLLSDGDVLGPFRTLHLPGHTKGSAGFYDEEAGVLFSGDTLFRSGIGRTDLSGGSFTEIQQSLKRLFTMDKSICVCPGHGPATTIGEEAGHTGYF
jgi:glyoxylase-like metal-dependent hydrolase (beta-lactamase superfamily II)